MGVKDRGFASMTPERRSEVARMGGAAARARGTARRWTPEQAREAGFRSAAARRLRLAQKASQS